MRLFIHRQPGQAVNDSRSKPAGSSQKRDCTQPGENLNPVGLDGMRRFKHRKQEEGGLACDKGHQTTLKGQEK
jgi:hypothetical protein